MDSYFLDTNILIRHLTQDHKDLSPIATQIFDQISEGEFTAHLTTLVLHETTYVLEKIYNTTRKIIASNLITILKFNHITVLDLSNQAAINALKDYSKTKVDFPDCVYKQLCLENRLKLLSFDHHFVQHGGCKVLGP